MVHTRNVGAGIGLVMLCWLGLYIHKDKWDSLGGSTKQSSQVCPQSALP